LKGDHEDNEDKEDAKGVKEGHKPCGGCYKDLPRASFADEEYRRKKGKFRTCLRCDIGRQLTLDIMHKVWMELTQNFSPEERTSQKAKRFEKVRYAAHQPTSYNKMQKYKCVRCNTQKTVEAFEAPHLLKYILKSVSARIVLLSRQKLNKRKKQSLPLQHLVYLIFILYLIHHLLHRLRSLSIRRIKLKVVKRLQLLLLMLRLNLLYLNQRICLTWLSFTIANQLTHGLSNTCFLYQRVP